MRQDKAESQRTLRSGERNSTIAEQKTGRWGAQGKGKKRPQGYADSALRYRGGLARATTDSQKWLSHLGKGRRLEKAVSCRLSRLRKIMRGDERRTSGGETSA